MVQPTELHGDPRHARRAVADVHRDALGADLAGALVHAARRRRRRVRRGDDRDEPRSRRDLRRSDRANARPARARLRGRRRAERRRRARRSACATIATTPIATRETQGVALVTRATDLLDAGRSWRRRWWNGARFIVQYDHEQEPVRPRRRRRADHARGRSRHPPRAGGVLMRALRSCCSLACDAAARSVRARLDVARRSPARSIRPGPFPGADRRPAASSVLHDARDDRVDRRRREHGRRRRSRRDARAARSSASSASTARGSCPPAPPDIETPDNADGRSRRSALAERLARRAVRRCRSPPSTSTAASARPRRAALIAVADAAAAPASSSSRCEWDGAADLDLHVVDPLGGEAWSGNPNTIPTPARARR